MEGPGAREAALAEAILAAAEAGRQIPRPTSDPGGLSAAGAARVAARIAALRRARGERTVGRKLAFTNTAIWPAYGVDRPLWAWLWERSVRPAPERFAPGRLPEPRIEPEIVLRLARLPEPGMDDAALMACVSHVAHGFEIVTSPYPGWRFAIPDIIAAQGLHGALLTGPWVAVAPGAAADWATALAGLSVELRRDGAEVARGTAGAVLGGGPLAALRHLLALLDGSPEAPALAPGEIVTTGTLTDAPPIAPGQHWESRIAGAPLPGLSVTII